METANGAATIARTERTRRTRTRATPRRAACRFRSMNHLPAIGSRGSRGPQRSREIDGDDHLLRIGIFPEEHLLLDRLRAVEDREPPPAAILRVRDRVVDGGLRASRRL